MTFWSVIQGPHLENDAGAFPDAKVIGTVVCHCSLTLARLYDLPGGISLKAFLPGGVVGNMDSRITGWTCVAHLDRAPAADSDHDAIADTESTGLVCRRGHHSTITAGQCREMAARYRQTGRKPRHPAQRVDNTQTPVTN